MYLETDERNSYFLAHLDIHPVFKGVSHDGTQGVPQDKELDDWIERQSRAVEKSSEDVKNVRNVGD